MPLVLWLPLLLLLTCWTWLDGWYDRPHQEAWRVRNAYKLLFLATFTYAILLTIKAASWQSEVRFMIERCR